MGATCPEISSRLAPRLLKLWETEFPVVPAGSGSVPGWNNRREDTVSRKLAPLKSPPGRIAARLFLLAGIAWGIPSSADQISDFVKIQTFKTHSRLTLRLDASVEAARQNPQSESVKGFEVLFKGLGLADLGAPFGAEGEWLRQIEAVTSSDPRLGSLRIKELESGILVRAQWKFPGGKSAPADPRMETFHYRKGNSYFVDFWPKPGPTAIEARAAGERRRKEEKLKAIESTVKARQDQRRQVAQAQAELEDSMRFCREPWDESREVFLQFNPVRSSFNFDRFFPHSSPDQEYPYSALQGDSEEAQYFRLAMKLFKREKFALVQKTLDFFDKKFKDSVLAVESKFLRANAMLRMGYEEQGMSALRKIISESPKTPPALHSAMFLAYKSLASGDSLGAFEQFMWLSQNHSTHRLNWVFHMGIGETLSNLRQAGKAAQEYRWVMENAPDPRSQVEGAVRIGDLSLERQQYDQALAAYFLALQEYPKELQGFPHYWINRAESLYWLGEHDRASMGFAEFLERFGGHPSAWRATYRLAEIEGRVGNERRAKELLIETINRFPYSPGSALARARVMACEPSQNPGAQGIKEFFDGEFNRYTGDGQVVMDRFADYRGLGYVRALLSAGAQEEAIAIALEELDGRSENKARVSVAKMLEHLFRKVILKKLGTSPNDDSRILALSYYNEFGSRVPHYPGNVESDYLLKLSQAAIDLGMLAWGQDIAKVHQSRVGADRLIASADPASLERRLLDSEKAATEARALWIEQGPGISKDAKSSAAFRSLLERVIEESPLSYERELMLSLLERDAGRPALALTHLLKAQALAPAAEREAPRMLFLLAGLQAGAGNARAAATTYRQLRQKLGESAEKGGADPDRLIKLHLPAPATLQAILLMECEQLTRLSGWGDIARVLAEGDQAGHLNSALRYEYAKALKRTGNAKDLDRSNEVLRLLAESAPEDFWKNLAREALNNPNGNAKEGRPQ